MASLTYEMNVDHRRDNYYVVKRDGVKFAHIFLLHEDKKTHWSVWVGLDMVAKKGTWNEAWNWLKAREVPEVVPVE